MSAASYEGALRDPFALTASVDDYVPSAAIEEALREASDVLASGRVPVIAGPTGLGKSLTLQLLARVFRERLLPLYVPYCALAPEELATLVLGLLEEPPPADPEQALLDAARRVAETGGGLLLLVDDASALPGESAAALAHWLNASGGALRIALAGLPDASLRHARDAFGDRAADVRLEHGLEPDEIRRYVEERLDGAGAVPELRAAFDRAALTELARVSAGNPRRLNLAAQAIVRNALGGADARARPGAGASGAPAQASASPASWQPPAGVGEYRFARGRFIDPKTGETLASPEPGWREELRATPRRPARRAPPPAPALHGADLDIDQDLGIERELESELFSGPDLAHELHGDAHGGFESDLSAEAPPERGAPQRAGELTSPSLEEAPASRRARPLPWVALCIVGLAFGVGVWTQLGRNAAEPAPASAPAARPESPASSPSQSAAAPVPSGSRSAAAPAEAPLVRSDPVAAIAQQQAAAQATETPAAPEPAGAPEPKPGSESATASEPGSTPAEFVPVAINATPWAVIEIDGEQVGETPLAGIRLSVGRHRFRARMPDGTLRERVVRIDADTTTVVFE